MHSQNGRWVLTFNGEIYSFQSLRQELEAGGAVFRTTSDTEVLVEYLARRGLTRTLERLTGMFAFGAWDRQERKLFLARDRLGQKPLFFGATPNGFVFGSELRVLKVYHPEARVSPEACALMLRYKSVPAPHTIYQGFNKLRPGHWVEYDLESGSLGNPEPYWTPAPSADPPDSEELKETFERAVAARLISDVPLGAFLSGGIDSSLVVATMQKLGSAQVKTFTIGFTQGEFNEAEQAREVARHLGTDHTEIVVSPDDLLSIVPELPLIYDEPFADSSQIPTILVSRLARKSVTVALSGDGGDESFAGYNRHLWLPRIARALHLFPGPALVALSNLLSWPHLEKLLVRLSERKLLPVRMVRDKLDKLRTLLKCRDYPSLYRQAVSDTATPEALLAAPVRGVMEEADWDATDDLLLKGCLADLQFYLPNDILVKVDRASMSCGLEARSPFLDHHLVEKALAAPASWKVGRNGGKVILREWLTKELPPHLFERPKMGFAVPLDEWLRGPLKEWAESLLTGRRASEWLAPGAALELWRQHQTGTRRHHHLLWNLLMLLAWLEENQG